MRPSPSPSAACRSATGSSATAPRTRVVQPRARASTSAAAAARAPLTSTATPTPTNTAAAPFARGATGKAAPAAATSAALATSALAAATAAAALILGATTLNPLPALAGPTVPQTAFVGGPLSADALASRPCDLVPVVSPYEDSPFLACDLHVGEGPEPLRNALSRVHFVISLGDRREAGDAAAASAGGGAPSLSSPVPNYSPPNPPFFTSRTKGGLGGGKPLLVNLGERDGVAAWDDAVLGGGRILSEGGGGGGGGGGAGARLPPMREGGVRRVVVPPGPLQRVNAKAMLWQASELDALDEVGEAASAAGAEAAGGGGGALGFRRDLVFTLELSVAKKRS